MAKLSVLEEFHSAIRNAAIEAQSGQTSLEIAAELCESSPELMEPFVEEWKVAKVASLIAAYRLKARREHDLQYQLGFRHLPRKIKLRSGQVVDGDAATIEPWRDRVRQLLKQKGPALQEAQEVVALMARYTKNPKQQRITWGEVKKREAKKKGISDATA